MNWAMLAAGVGVGVVLALMMGAKKTSSGTGY